MKEHQLSLHMLKQDTIIQDYCTQEEQRLFGRNEVHGQGIKQLTPSAIVEVVNVFFIVIMKSDSSVSTYLLMYCNRE